MRRKGAQKGGGTFEHNNDWGGDGEKGKMSREGVKKQKNRKGEYAEVEKRILLGKFEEKKN